MHLFRSDTHVYDILAAIAEHDATKTYLGIGVQEGNCVAAVVKTNPVIDLVLCDTWGSRHGGTGRGNPNHIADRLLQAAHRGPVTFLSGESQVEIPKLPPTPQFDLSFVDGDHQEEPAFDDLCNTWPRTRGVMVVHDVHMFPVWSALARYVAMTAHQMRVVYCSAGTGTAICYRVGGTYGE